MNLSLIEKQAIVALVEDAIKSTTLRNCCREEYERNIRNKFNIENPLDYREYETIFKDRGFDRSTNLEEKDIELMQERIAYFRLEEIRKKELIKKILMNCEDSLYKHRIIEKEPMFFHMDVVENTLKELHCDVGVGFIRRLDSKYIYSSLVNEVLHMVISSLVLNREIVKTLNKANSEMVVDKIMELVKAEVMRFGY